MGNGLYQYRFYWNGERNIKLLDSGSRRTFYERSLEDTVAARTDVGLVMSDLTGPALKDPSTIWIVEQVQENPEYVSGYRARGVTYLDNPNSTEVITEHSPWLDLDWFVPIGAQQKET
jgi:hypothetical protein